MNDMPGPLFDTSTKVLFLFIFSYIIVRMNNPFIEALSPAFIHGAADLWSHPLAYGATAEQQLQLHQQALLHPALQQQLPVRSFL